MPDDPKEWFRTLDLTPGASLEEIKRSYRELAKVWHPDRFAHDPSLLRKSQEKMKQLNDAYRQVCELLERFGEAAFGNAGRAGATTSDKPADSRFRSTAAPSPERKKPTPPSVLFVKAGDASARLSWGPVYGAGCYNVKRSLTSGGPYNTIAQGVAWTEYADNSVVNGTRYFYVISSSDGSRESADSSELTVEPCAAPAPPADLKATISEESAEVHLQWAQSASRAICWNLIYRSDNEAPFLQIAQISPGTTYVDRQFIRGASCKYVVTAVNANAQQSAHSNSAAVQAK